MSDEIHSYIQLQQQIHHALRVQHPEQVEPNGNSPNFHAVENDREGFSGPSIAAREYYAVIASADCK